ncbi:hypothetical protein DLE97_23890 [Salmonella enterica subsp. enterica serovar Manhattan]|nr:hypothetical protein [Salmonella enterica subsp. enterica serovar Manhattan]EBU8724787.1 hypothetical protein [Salmonella enterica subsp. enterica serovar Manhattan]EBX6960637.1 hypothetical protein [Salmonella enterica subsp. enterica serovar Manhattan]EBZ1791712.1 hypothetical protein [Salmonella enterica subsp. enterica serovar Manhattan]
MYILSVPGMVIRWIFLAFTLYSLYQAAGVGGHLWDIWAPVSSEKTETSHLAAFVGVVVILSIWLTGAISATVLMYFTWARFQSLREYHDA